ncbi:MAG: hypothetical protein AB7Q17_15185 [Phycisphaerae bacterium]
MKKSAPPPSPTRPALLRFLVFAGALALTWIAGCDALRLVREWPRTQLATLREEDLVRAIRNTIGGATGDAQVGMRLAGMSTLITRALRGGDDELANARAQASQRLAQLHGTDLGRIQHATLVMLALERARTPADDWWPAVEPYLGALEHATFAHRQQPLTDAYVAAYRQAGLRPTAACEAALLLVGNPHGPFIQFFASRATTLATALETTDPAHAEYLHALVARVLRAIVLERGADGLRLQAADSLIAELERRGEVETRSRFASELSRYRAELARHRPALVSPTRAALSLVSATQVDRAAASTYFHVLILIAALLLALLTGWGWIARRAEHAPRRPWLRRHLATLLTIAVGIIILMALNAADYLPAVGDGTIDELLAVENRLAGGRSAADPLLPALSVPWQTAGFAVAFVGLTAAAAWALARRRGLLPAVGRSAVLLLGLSALATLVSVAATRAALRDHDRAIEVWARGDHLAEFDEGAVLAAIRAWTP